MNAQRSMTDEQILAKYGYDKKPYSGPFGHRRSTLMINFTYEPRPAFIPFVKLDDELPPVNPILSAFRKEQNEPLMPMIEAYLLTLDSWERLDYYTPDQIDFARAVLTRLANLTAVSL